MPYQDLRDLTVTQKESFLLDDWAHFHFTRIPKFFRRKNILLKISNYESQILTGQTIGFAGIYLPHGNVRGQGRLLAYPLRVQYDEPSATWTYVSSGVQWPAEGAQPPSREETPVDPDGIVPMISSASGLIIDITSQLPIWLDNTNTNKGIVIQVDPDSPHTSLADGEFISHEGGAGALLVVNQYIIPALAAVGADTSRCSLTLTPADLLDEVFWDVSDDEPAYWLMDGFIRQVLCQLDIVLQILRGAWYVRSAEELPRYTTLLGASARNLPYSTFRRRVEDLWLAHTTPITEYAIEAIVGTYANQPAVVYRMDSNHVINWVLGESYLNDWDPIDGTWDPKDGSHPALCDPITPSTQHQNATPSPASTGRGFDPTYLYTSYEQSHGLHVEFYGLCDIARDPITNAVDTEEVADVQAEMTRMLSDISGLAPIQVIWHNERQPPGHLAIGQLGADDDDNYISVFGNSYAMNGWDSMILENMAYVVDPLVTLPGVTLIARSANTPRGVGYIKWNSTSRLLSYQAPGDSDFGPAQTVDTSTNTVRLTLESASEDLPPDQARTVTLDVIGSELPDTPSSRTGAVVEIVIPGTIGVVTAGETARATTPAIALPATFGPRHRVQIAIWDRILSDRIRRTLSVRLGNNDDPDAWDTDYVNIRNQDRIDTGGYSHIQLRVTVTDVRRTADYELGGFMIKDVGYDYDDSDTAPEP